MCWVMGTKIFHVSGLLFSPVTAQQGLRCDDQVLYKRHTGEKPLGKER